MGTRGIISAVIGGELKLANFGQWDHNKKVQGIRILTFLRILAADEWEMDRFKRNLGNCVFLTPDQVSAIEEMNVPFPYHLSRDRGAGIFDIILVGPQALANSIGFVGSWDCVSHFQIDFDAMTFDGFDINNLPTDEEYLA